MASTRAFGTIRKLPSGRFQARYSHFGRQVSASAVRSWHGRLVRSGLSPNTAAKVYRRFRTIMSTAVDDGLLRSNPVSIKGAALERSIERPLLTWEDVARLADAIEPRFHALIWVAAVSGLRFGELTALDRSRVDIDVGTIRVDRALGFVKGSGPTMGPPKSDAAYRVVAIPEQTCDLVRAHLIEYTGADADALVFTSVKGSPLLNRYFAPRGNGRRPRRASTQASDSTTCDISPAQRPPRPARRYEK